MTIDDVFDTYEVVIRRLTANAIFAIDFDEYYGYPTRIYVDRPDRHDDESTFLISDFDVY
jgi:hypothetical protein